MQLQLGEVLAIIISSPKVAKEVLKTHDAAFANRPVLLAIEVMSYDNSGNLHQLIFFQPHRCLRDLAKKYGPIMQLQLGEVLAIIISSPKVAKEVLKTHDAAFANRPVLLAIEVISYDNSGMIFAPYDEYWRQMRKLCVMQFLSAKRIQSLRSIREEEVWNLIEGISSSAGLQINFTEKISSSTYGITARAAIGKKCKYEEELISLIKETFILIGGFEVPDLFPSLKFLSFLTGN
nr:premnaspirodiene oxygenase [Quercus suber]